jgi:hypothetical protein
LHAREKRPANYSTIFQHGNYARVPKAKKPKPILRYSDGTPVIVGRKKKKNPGEETGQP